ncbi:unconventional myosin-XVI-like [Conger conger]|uniref:unconventional myosin-XVI-like n=1 Tax=Conger conger TaxID=82655 RepID=UPI002A5B0CBF|nr:unconventional myosin-XVI-like [Conger conger]
MEIEQCLLDSLPLGQRQRLVRRMRCDQIRAYYEREQALPRPRPKRGRSRRVRFGPDRALQDAILRHDDREVLSLLREGADPNTHTPSGGSLPNTRTPSGGSLLHLCARHDNSFAAELLIGCGLAVDLQDEDLWTALHIASSCGHSDSTLLLLLAGADAQLRDVNGNTPLDYAPEGSETRLILQTHLEENGVDVGALRRGKAQRSAAMFSDVQRLVATGGSVNQSNGDGVTLLHIACASGYRDVVSLLLKSGADPQLADGAYWTPLHLAAKYGQSDVIGQLLDQHANPALLTRSLDRPSDVAATANIAKVLRRAEESWELRQADPSAPAMTSLQLCEGISHDAPAPAKLLPLAVPISKRDSLQERETMFRDFPGGSARGGSQENSVDTLLASRGTKPEQVRLVPPAPSDDLASLSELTDSSLLYEMQKRFGNDQIYTYIGHILLLVNPHKELPIYSTLVSQLYLSSSGRLCSSLPPHVFSSAERAFHMMLQERRPQCFILSGESGSGKTEACKHIVKHLMARSSHKTFPLEARMKNVNCILEAFGHAKTEMNDNSSRFIKFLSLQYSEKKRTLVGARVYAYMLEKSRLTSTQNQRNFKVFHLMAEGMLSEEKGGMHLNNMLTHRYLSGGEAGEGSGAQSRERLTALRQALRALGFNSVEVENLFVILSAIVLLGDLRFGASAEHEAASVSDPQLLEKVSETLQVTPEDLGSVLTSDVQYFKGDVITRRHGADMAGLCRDLLAKSLYGRVFSYLVNHINCYLQQEGTGLGDPELEIGILDIFGFEEFQRNGFEQLCVNMSSERIRQYVTDALFLQEQADSLHEGVAMETLHSPGNQPAVLDFIFQEPQGLLLVLDEESRAQQPSEQNLYKRLQAQLDAANGNSINAISLTTKDGNGNPPPQDQGPSFTVSHYAGKVTYDLTGSLERNKDALPQNILFLMKSSENVLVHQVFRSKLTQTGSLVPSRHHLRLRGFPEAPKPAPLLPSAGQDPKNVLDVRKILRKEGGSSLVRGQMRYGPATVAVQLRNSLSEISAKLRAGTPHFLQCVKPNGAKRPDCFERSHVSAQLQYVGVLEMVRMIRYGYPVRLPFATFLARYRELVEMMLGEQRSPSPEEQCQLILQKCQLQGWQMGGTKVFLRYWQADHLSDRCHQLQRRVVCCQKVVRGWLVRRRGLHQQEACSVQRFLQGAEDQGLQAYDRLVIQNASDIARENDRKRNALNGVHAGERPEPLGKEDEPISRAVEPSGRAQDGGPGGGRLIRHYRSSSGPLPLALENLVQSAAAASSIKTAPRDPANEDGGGGSGLPSPRKQPPPKPKRDPNTRLSASYEAVAASLALGLKETTVDELSKPRPHSDDYSARKVPPPKPIRSPNTKLTGSFEEICPPRPTDIKLSCVSKAGPSSGASSGPSSGPHCAALSLYRPLEEDAVYIEMGASAKPGTAALEPGEAVYEEMKYFSPEAVTAATKASLANRAASSPPQTLEIRKPSEHPPAVPGGREIPPPFPNLLPHRPPLLVFPPSPPARSPTSDESPLTPLEVKKLPVLDTSLSYPAQSEGSSPLSPQYARQRADSSPSLFAFLPDKSTPPLTPPPPAAQAPPPYRPPSHFPFPPEGALLLTRGGSLTCDSPRLSQRGPQGSEEAPGRPPYSPVKAGRPEPRRAHSCCSSPLLFNPASSRPLTSPLDELTTLFSAGRTLLRKSPAGRKLRETGFNSNINLSGRDESGMTSPSPQLQDKNANNHSAPHHHPHLHYPLLPENGNQLSNGSLDDEGHSRSNGSATSSLHRHLDSHHSQVAPVSRLSQKSAALQELLEWRRTDWQRLLRAVERHPASSPPPLRKNSPASP